MEQNQHERNRDRIALLLKIGILGAAVILAGDLTMGWGVRSTELSGIEGQLSPYLTVSDSRMFWSFLFGLIGVPMAVVGHWGIYQLLRPFSRKYARLYAIGNLGFLIFGGAGMHGASVEAAFLYQYLTSANPAQALEATVKFAVFFLLPLYGIVILGWILMVYAHTRAVSGGFSPFPRWAAFFSMLTGTVLFSLIGSMGNSEILNALTVGAFSLGNIWSLGGHLWLLRRMNGK